MKPLFCAKVFCFATLVALAATASAKTCLVYFGTYTYQLSRGIYVSRLDTDTGRLTAPKLAVATPSPTFINFSPDGKFLYAANAVMGFSDYRIRNGGAVSAFAVDKTSGRLTLLNKKYSGGTDPCYVSVDASGQVLFTANYGSGSIKSFLLSTNGHLAADGTVVGDVGHGSDPMRQDSPHAHCISADPSNRFVLQCDLGTDEVKVYPFATNDATIAAAKAQSFKVPPGSGPRHLAFSGDGKFVHVINEMACTITTFAWDSAGGKLDLIETVSALPPGVAVWPEYAAAEILVHPSGKFVYATVRGHDSVSVFAADAQSGRLTLVQNVSAGGQVARGLGIDPTGRWLITANQKSQNAVEFAIDPATGKISATGQVLKISSPVDVKFAK